MKNSVPDPFQIELINITPRKRKGRDLRHLYQMTSFYTISSRRAVGRSTEAHLIPDFHVSGSVTATGHRCSPPGTPNNGRNLAKRSEGECGGHSREADFQLRCHGVEGPCWAHSQSLCKPLNPGAVLDLDSGSWLHVMW